MVIFSQTSILTWYLFLSNYLSVAAINFVIRDLKKSAEVFCIKSWSTKLYLVYTKLALTVFHSNQWSAFLMLQHPKWVSFSLSPHNNWQSHQSRSGHGRVALPSKNFRTLCRSVLLQPSGKMTFPTCGFWLRNTVPSSKDSTLMPQSFPKCTISSTFQMT